VSGTAVRVGDELPPVEGETQSGHIDLAQFRGSKHVVLWSYPMDDTPG
jgi:peroxiredoxin